MTWSDNWWPGRVDICYYLESVGTAGLEIESTEAPVLQLPHKVLGTDALGQVELALPVEAEDVLEDPRGSVEVELSTDQAEWVTEREDLRCVQRAR